MINLGSLLQNVVGPLASAGGDAALGLGKDKELAIAQELNKRQQAHQDMMDNLALTKGNAEVKHLGAETDALTGTDKDYAGHVFDNEGKPWIVHKDGTLSEATVRGATHPTAAPSAAQPSATPAVASPAAPSAATPHFGVKQELTPKDFTLDGKPVSGFVDKTGKHYDASGMLVRTGTIAPYVAPSYTATAITGPDGKQIMARVNTKTGEIAPTDVLAKQPAGGAGVNAPAMAAAKANLESARKTMDDFEAKLASGQASYGPVDATKGALGSSEKAQTASGPLGGIESLMSNYAGASLRGNNAELAKYLKAKKFVAEAILNTHRRPNQTQYEIEQELSGIGPRLDGFTSEDAKSQIAQSKERRDRMYEEVFANPNAGAVSGPAKAKPSGKSISVNGKTFTLPD